jgi:hypothetical protein
LQEPGRLGWEVFVSNSEDAKKVLIKHGNTHNFIANNKSKTNTLIIEMFPKCDFFKGAEYMLLSRFYNGSTIPILNGHGGKIKEILQIPPSVVPCPSNYLEN